jgi:hypothetical protein
VLAKLAAGHGLAIVLLAGVFLQNHPKRGRLLLHRGMGQVAAADSFCTNVHHIDKVVYVGITISKLLYETAHW